MDSGAAEAIVCNGDKPSGIKNSVGLGVERGEAEEEGDETSSLLPHVGNRGAGDKKQKSTRRKVQWNDRNGNKLVEVWEFQPSDSSDSEDEDADPCICSIM